jgi:hypothetical protein
MEKLRINWWVLPTCIKVDGQVQYLSEARPNRTNGSMDCRTHSEGGSQ